MATGFRVRPAEQRVAETVTIGKSLMENLTRISDKKGISLRKVVQDALLPLAPSAASQLGIGVEVLNGGNPAADGKMQLKIGMTVNFGLILSARALSRDMENSALIAEQLWKYHDLHSPGRAERREIQEKAFNTLMRAV